jgi:hypothetical protein
MFRGLTVDQGTAAAGTRLQAIDSTGFPGTFQCTRNIKGRNFLDRPTVFIIGWSQYYSYLILAPVQVCPGLSFSSMLRLNGCCFFFQRSDPIGKRRENFFRFQHQLINSKPKRRPS